MFWINKTICWQLFFFEADWKHFSLSEVQRIFREWWMSKRQKKKSFLHAWTKSCLKHMFTKPEKLFINQNNHFENMNFRFPWKPESFPKFVGRSGRVHHSWLGTCCLLHWHLFIRKDSHLSYLMSHQIWPEGNMVYMGQACVM